MTSGPLSQLVVTIAVCIWSFISPAAANGADLKIQAVTSAVLSQRLRGAPTDNSERAERLYETFREAGCQEPELSTQTVKGTKVPNVICTLPGRSDELVVVGAHLDTVKGSPGVLDNWSSAIMLPSLYHGLSISTPRHHTYLFVGFAGEERGLKGSKGFVKPELCTDSV